LRIPFDSLTLAAVVHDLQTFVGAKVQRISQPGDTEVVFELYGAGGVGHLLLSCHPEFSRVHLSTKKPGNPSQPPQFCTALPARVGVSRIVAIRQVRFDRVLEIEFESPEGEFTLIAELMGKHSNLMLVDSGHKVIAAAKWIGKSKSVRPIQAGARYNPPPFEIRPSLLQAAEGSELKGLEGSSPFLVNLIAAMGQGGLGKVQSAVLQGQYEPVLVAGSGAYPMSVEPLGLTGQSRSSISVALEQHFDQAIPAFKAETLKGSLRGQIARVLLARETAIRDLTQAVEAGKGAGGQQMLGELILAYGASLPEGAATLEAVDYEGEPITIKLNPELDFKKNANRYFDKAKRAKARLGTVNDQLLRLSQDREDIVQFLARLEGAAKFFEVERLYEEAKTRRWLNKPAESKAAKEDRPYAGHRVRELLGPGGYAVLYGENAESNDYLTLRVAKPNDWWLHIRGSTSAHVIIQTRNQPDKVQRETLLYAAKIAVQNSPSKHAGYVPVDYTLKKYVRKPKGAAVGAAVYTHEKTLHVDLDKSS
jgi:predicted ribosome quality control (RQC) complex YloA/Tae2 family protein